MTDVDGGNPVSLFTGGQCTPFLPDRRVGALCSVSPQGEEADDSSEGGSERNPTHDYGRGGWDNEDILDARAIYARQRRAQSKLDVISASLRAPRTSGL